MTGNVRTEYAQDTICKYSEETRRELFSKLSTFGHFLLWILAEMIKKMGVFMETSLQIDPISTSSNLVTKTVFKFQET